MGSFCRLSLVGLLFLLCSCSTQPNGQQELAPLLGQWQRFDQQLAKHSDPLARDLLLIQLAVASPRFAPDLCKRTESQGAKEKCRQVVGRPHLRTAK